MKRNGDVGIWGGSPFLESRCGGSSCTKSKCSDPGVWVASWFLFSTDTMLNNGSTAELLRTAYSDSFFFTSLLFSN
jgi:hypothetical protein